LITEQQATAPGKLVVVGEYAVLHGGAALAVSAGRRATASLRPADASQLRILNSDSAYAFGVNNGAVEWVDDPGPQGSLLAAAVAALHARDIDVAALGPFSIELCSREFYAEDAEGRSTKLGLGSSAAVAVALSGCLQKALVGAATLDFAIDVHRAHQRGQGSGIDVMTSFTGGAIEWRAGKPPRDVSWPDGLAMRPVWTGKAASTAPMLRQLEKFSVSEPQQHRQLIAALSTTSAATCDAADAPSMLAALAEYAVRLRELDVTTKLGIWSAEHEAIAGLAADVGVVYKPSGAGGGDFGLAFGTDNDALQAFTDLCEQAGFWRGDFELGVKGLSL